MINKWTTAAMGLVVGVLVTFAWQAGLDRNVEPADVQEERRGPHGGRLFRSETVTLEVTIYEEGVPPQFRVFPTTPTGSPLAPGDVQLEIVLERLGGRIDRIPFRPETDYLLGTATVEEPHSFIVKGTATHLGRASTFTYEQIEGRTTIADSALASSGIEVSTAGAGDLIPMLDLPGEVVVPPDRQVRVYAGVSGLLTAVHVKTGQAVRRGDVLATVTSRDVAAAASAYLAAVGRTQFARATRDREEDLAKRRITAMQDFLLADQAYVIAQTELTVARQTLSAFGLDESAIAALAGADPATLSRLPIRATLDGVVTEQTAAAGELVRLESPIVTITDTRQVWVNVQVHARDLAVVRPGRRVTVTSVGPGLTTAGTIASVSPVIGDETRTATARVVVVNTQGRWQPGLFATVAVELERTTASVVVPTEALQTFRDWTVVFVRYGDVFEARPVELGRTDGRRVEILSGLLAGERFASRNAFAVKADVLKSGASHGH